ncbi:hypothetical protein JWS13_03925 (plasmid) [Rhodococcus pseudokoreensis]|uniref:Uncharacterized protein n=1 Tax=Rhodococcus pseudokoreensis TaxID=2811421 RepID=A0A974ZRM8_9NOCA|nr:hypothetical protein [Rhodococcus pseudokoreensis]QSE87820.1 hypothetical protein JWS13_03925 [Rhodococcus pseudokoreensis]
MTLAADTDVVWAAYTAASGSVDAATPDDRTTGCARCGHTTPVMTPVGQVISRRFTGFESWTNLAARKLCQVCAWAYRDRTLRSDARIVTRDPATLRTATPTLLHQVLSTTLGADTAVIVPLRPGRKHLIPDARWGAVTVDDSRLNWAAEDARRLEVMCRLRDRGFTETMLRDNAPTYSVVHRLPADRWPQVFDDWNLLAPWRHADPWWEVGLRATRHQHTPAP